jgi:hypothetical protein
MPFSLAFRVLPTSRASLRRVVCRNERLSRAGSSAVTAGEARTSTARVIEHGVRSPSSPNDAAHQTPKRPKHLPSGPPDSPRGARTLDRNGSHSPIPPANRLSRMRVSRPILCLPGRASDSGASTGVVPSCGSLTSSSLGTARRCCHLCSVSASNVGLPRCPTNAPPRDSSDGDASAQYPIGWIHQHCRRLPAFGVGSSATACCHLFRPVVSLCPAWSGFGRDYRATSPPRGRSSPTLPNTRGPSTFGTQRMPPSVSLHDAVRVLAKHLRDLERSFRRPQLVASPCQGRRSPQQTHGAAGMSPHLRRSDVRVTARRRTGRCRTTDPVNTRFTLTDRQPRLAASTTNRLDQPKLCDCRSDTTVHPRGTRLGGVATTFPARSTLEASELRWNLHRPDADTSRSPWNRLASAPGTSAPRQAGSRRCCSPPSRCSPDRLSLRIAGSSAASGTSMSPPTRDSR